MVAKVNSHSATIWGDSNHFVCVASLCVVDQSSLRLTRSHQYLFNDLFSKSTIPEKLIIYAYSSRTLFIFLFQARTQILNMLKIFSNCNCIFVMASSNKIWQPLF